LANQSQVTDKAEVIGRAIYNPPQVYNKNIVIDDKLVHKKGDPNPCDIHGFIIDGVVYSLPVGETYLFPDRIAEVLLGRFSWLKEVKAKKKNFEGETVPFTPAPTREPTEKEAPLLARARRKAARGQKLFALTSTGDRVEISPMGVSNVPTADIVGGSEDDHA